MTNTHTAALALLKAIGPTPANIAEIFAGQDQKGREKYGKSVDDYNPDPATLEMMLWEELADAATYLTRFVMLFGRAPEGIPDWLAFRAEKAISGHDSPPAANSPPPNPKQRE